MGFSQADQVTLRNKNQQPSRSIIRLENPSRQAQSRTYRGIIDFTSGPNTGSPVPSFHLYRPARPLLICIVRDPSLLCEQPEGGTRCFCSAIPRGVLQRRRRSLFGSGAGVLRGRLCWGGRTRSSCRPGDSPWHGCWSLLKRSDLTRKGNEGEGAAHRPGPKSYPRIA